MERDRKQTIKLEHDGWRVIRLWEHEVWTQPERALVEISQYLESGTRRRLSWRVRRVVPLDAGGQMEQRELVELRQLRPGYREEHHRHTRKW